MSDFLIAPVAGMDLDEIWEYYAIELQNPDAADRIRDEIFAAFHTLTQTPGMGHFRSDLAKEPLRFWHVRSYPIIYRSEKHPIEIARVFHGARDVRAVLAGQKERKKPRK
jgi:plasmid stabilization system protein ParE